MLLEPAGRETRTRIGGPPLLPPDVPWPRSESGNPYVFLAAIDFSEMPRLEPLPEEGTLAVYWNFLWHHEDRRGQDYFSATCAFFSANESFATAEPETTPQTPVLSELSVQGRICPVPGEQNAILREVPAVERDQVAEVMNQLTRELGIYNHLLGSSLDVQGPVLEEIPYHMKRSPEDVRARFTDSERNGEGWVLLLQLNETRGVAELVIGDGGSLYFVIPEVDLRARNFDRLVGILQSN